MENEKIIVVDNADISGCEHLSTVQGFWCVDADCACEGRTCAIKALAELCNKHNEPFYGAITCAEAKDILIRKQIKIIAENEEREEQRDKSRVLKIKSYYSPDVFGTNVQIGLFEKGCLVKDSDIIFDDLLTIEINGKNIDELNKQYKEYYFCKFERDFYKKQYEKLLDIFEGKL